MVQTPTVPPPHPRLLPISSFPGHRRPHLLSLAFPPGHHLISPSNFTLFCAAVVCFLLELSLQWGRIRTLSCCLFSFFPLVPLTAPGAERQLAGPVFPRKEKEGWWGRQRWAQLAGGIEMAPRDPILGLGARMAQPPPRCEHGAAGREGAEFLPRKLAAEMVLGTFTLYSVAASAGRAGTGCLVCRGLF